MPVRLLVAARTETTGFRRLYRKPLPVDPSATSVPSFSPGREERDSNPYDEIEKTRSRPEQTDARHVEPTQYSTVHQVLQSGTGEEIRPDEVIKGYEIAPNEFAVINPREIKAAEIETSDTIDLFHFVKGAEVDPIYFERSYYVAPESGSEKAYVLLLEAMRKEECFGIARIGMHRREHMLILRPSEDYLIAHTMFYANEVRPAPHVELTTEVSNKELSMATTLIKGYEGEFKPKEFKDLYQERVHKIIDASVSNRIPMHPSPKTPTSGAPDLMEQIRLSLAELESKKPVLLKNQVRKAPKSVKKKSQRLPA
jgi:DNA end-binding protein Ku